MSQDLAHPRQSASVPPLVTGLCFYYGMGDSHMRICAQATKEEISHISNPLRRLVYSLVLIENSLQYLEVIKTTTVPTAIEYFSLFIENQIIMKNTVRQRTIDREK